MKKPAVILALLFLMNVTACVGTQTAATSAADPAEKETASSGASLQEETTSSQASTEPTTDKEPEQQTKQQTETESKTEPESPAETIATAKVDILLTGAPEISLNDALSSTLNGFIVQSGNYKWSYLDGKKTESVVACGSHPLDIAPDKAQKLSVPIYNRMDSAPYTVSCVVPPDRITVRQWDSSQLGSMEAKEESSTVYEDAFIIDLQPDKVYEIVAEWEEAKLQTNGFYGEASYALITD